MKKLLLSSIAALFLATSAHAQTDTEREQGYDALKQVLRKLGTAHAREKAKGIPTKPPYVVRECPTKFSPEGKLENEREIKSCFKSWNATIAHPEKGQWVWRWRPPVEYDKPYEGVLITQRLPIDQLHKICAPYQLACTMPISTGPNGIGWRLGFDGNRVACLMILPPDSYILEHHQDPKEVLRHELGHCNGWPSDHPNSQSKWEWVEK